MNIQKISAQNSTFGFKLSGYTEHIMQEAREKLEKEANGRAYYLPLDSFMNKPAPSAEGKSDMSWALMKLEPKYRDVIYLYYHERCKVEEIAQILRKNPNTVKTLLKRGREKLKVIYGGD